jgi:hypothetical protein
MFVASHKRAGWKWSRPRLLFSAYRGILILRVKWLKRDLKHSVPSVPRLRMCVATPLLPHGAQGPLRLC